MNAGKIILGCALILALILGVYWPALSAGWIWDDAPFLYDNSAVTTLSGIKNIWWSADSPDYFPITSTALWLGYRLWGADPRGYHLVNILIHAAATMVLWRVIAGLYRQAAIAQPDLFGLMAVLAFAAHPMNVSSVAWVTELKNTLSLLLYAACFLLYMKFDEKPGETAYWAAVVVFLLALLAKTSGALLPIVLLAYVWRRRGGMGRNDVFRIVPFFIIAAMLSVVTIWFQSERAIATDEFVVREDGVDARSAAAGWAVWFYLGKLLWPLGTAMVYKRWVVEHDVFVNYLPGIILLAVIGVLWWRRNRIGRGVFLAIVAYLALLFPVLGFFNISFMKYSLVANHWQYMPSIAVIGAIFGAIGVMAKRSRGKARMFVFAGGIFIAMNFAAMAACQTPIYRNPRKLWRQNIIVNPAAWVAHSCYGTEYWGYGECDLAKVEMGKALDAKDNFYDWNNLGVVLGAMGDMEAAKAACLRVLKFTRTADALTNLGVVYLNMKNYDAAMEYFDKAINTPMRTPLERFRYTNAYFSRGNLYALRGEYEKAITDLSEAINIRPAYLEAYFRRGNLYALRGEYEKAVADFSEAINICPEYSEAYLKRGTTLAHMMKYGEAIADFNKALSAAPRSKEGRMNRGTLLMEMGKFRDAMPDFSAVIALESGDKEGKQYSADAYAHRGICLMKLNGYDEAAGDFSRALALNPEMVDLFANRLKCRLRIGELELAEADYKSCVELGVGLDQETIDALNAARSARGNNR